jgi:protein regulator of cytokinesis 1
VDLRWLHSELALPPLPTGTASNQFPIELLPNRKGEETPGAYQTYERMLARFMATYKEANEGEVEETGLDDLQPEIGLVNWINELSNLVCQSSYKNRFELMR